MLKASCEGYRVMRSVIGTRSGSSAGSVSDLPGADAGETLRERGIGGPRDHEVDGVAACLGAATGLRAPDATHELRQLAVRRWAVLDREPSDHVCGWHDAHR